MPIAKLIRLVLSLTAVTAFALGAYAWMFCREDVSPGQVLIVTTKYGDPLPPGEIIAQPGQLGVQAEALGPGRYFFRFPFTWNYETERVALTEISAGNPATWREVYAAGKPDYEIPKLAGEWPEVGIVTSLAGQNWDKDTVVVDPGFKGVQREVLTPGTYRINTRAFEVVTEPAVVVPIGCVGVVTSQDGSDPGTEVIRETSIGPDGELIEGPAKVVQKLASPGERGVLRDVLQPGIYYLNPFVHKVKIVQVGYNQITQSGIAESREEITFPSADGFTIAVELTVVWGRNPKNIPEMINRLGEVERIREIILGQTRSICRNVGSQYVSTDFIEGERREQYQQTVTETLRTVCRERDIDILLVLIQNIHVRGGSADQEGLDLRKTIQRGYIAREENLTKQKQQETAAVKAELETAIAGIEVARENVSADTRKQVAEIKADGQKQAEEINAQRDLEVAQVDRQIAELDAERVRVLGRAETDVERAMRQAEADGKSLFVAAFGSGRAYNLYTFAQEFEPESVRLIFAGEGTFWTDLSRLQDAGSLELLRSQNVNQTDATQSR